MKKQLLFCATFLLALNLSAQDQKPAVIVSTTGKVKLISAGKSKARTVEAGAAANPTGKLKLAKDAKATIYCNGQFKEVSGKQTTELSSLCDGSGTRKMDADFEFGEKLMAAVEMVAVAKKRGDGWSNAVGDPKKGGDGWGNAVGNPKKGGDGWGNAVGNPKKGGDGWGNAVGNPKKGGDGWGGEGSAIRLIMPFGKLVAGKTTFTWSKPKNTEPYQLVILDDSGKEIHTITVSDTFAIIDLKSSGLLSDQIYHWKVTVPGINPIESNELAIGLDSEQALAMVSKNAKASGLSKDEQHQVLAGLVEAVAFENNEWHYAANQAYIALEQKTDNNLVRMMHAAFWMRYGYKRLAEKTAMGK